jgi:WD40 repeat protein
MSKSIYTPGDSVDAPGQPGELPQDPAHDPAPSSQITLSEPRRRPWKYVYADRLCYRKRTLSGHSSVITCMQVLDSILVTGSADKTLRVWDLTTGTCLRVLEGHERSVNALHCDRVGLSS